MSKLKKALQRAHEARGEAKNFLNPPKAPLHPLLKKHGIDIKPADQKKIDIKYSRTKVERLDQTILRRNKVLSLFKENQTTDQVDNLRTQILDKLEQIGGNSLLVTSAHPGEGKTFISINLAVSIAQELDKTVLLIDTDLRHPWKYHYDFAGDFWGFKADKGLADYLTKDLDIADLLINPGIEKLTLLPAGGYLPNSAELLSSNRMAQFIHEVKSRYGSDRICIFDCPALLRYSDPLVISDLVDGILLVVEAERTTPDEMKKVVKLLEGKNVLGTVFNKSKEQHKNDYV
ncbi:MAG: polysaccharide biosynthesis tyrosine autokinase [Desulfobacteraceae bacterium]|nr:polysaccharide biosynthesis tyrosine autokinase [Desulfobacteraceae bacterium]